MPDFAYRTEATIDAAPKVLFDIVSDLSLHVELAGSGELKTVTQKPAGDVEMGTRFLAEESVKLADGSGMDVTCGLRRRHLRHAHHVLVDRQPSPAGPAPPGAVVVPLHPRG